MIEIEREAQPLPLTGTLMEDAAEGDTIIAVAKDRGVPMPRCHHRILDGQKYDVKPVPGEPYELRLDRPLHRAVGQYKLLDFLVID